MHPKKLSIADFDYPLPEEKIAVYPLSERDQSKLLIYRNGNISEDIYRNIAEHLPENSFLIFNYTKVPDFCIIKNNSYGGQPFNRNV